MKSLLITESEKNRILNMHKSRFYLTEEEKKVVEIMVKTGDFSQVPPELITISSPLKTKEPQKANGLDNNIFSVYNGTSYVFNLEGVADSSLINSVVGSLWYSYGTQIPDYKEGGKTYRPKVSGGDYTGKNLKDLVDANSYSIGIWLPSASGRIFAKVGGSYKFLNIEYTEQIENSYASSTSISITSKSFGLVRGSMYTRFDDVTIDKKKMSVDFFPNYIKNENQNTAKSMIRFNYKNDGDKDEKLYFTVIGPDNTPDTTEALIIPANNNDSYVQLDVEVNFSSRGKYVVKMNDPSKYYKEDSKYTDGQLVYSVL
jgi:hypothetical protein